MATQHESHTHQHGPNCGHTAIKHDGHTDYLHDGHLHHPSAGQVEEHRLEVDSAHPAACTPDHNCGKHEAGHQHGPGCGHEAIPHGDHIDYLVAGHRLRPADHGWYEGEPSGYTTRFCIWRTWTAMDWRTMGG